MGAHHKLLVASTKLEDEFFRAVILVLDHDQDGAVGVVLNHPSRMPVSEILPEWDGLPTDPTVIFRGGPVAPDTALFLARLKSDSIDLAETLPGVQHITDDIALLNSDANPDQLIEHVDGVRAFAGYAGWSPGQLESELAEKSWHVVDPALGDILSPEPRDTWARVLKRQPAPLSWLATYPDDPNHN